MALVTTQGLSATLPISEANVTNLTADLATLTTAASVLRQRVTSLSSAQIMTLFSSPVEVVPAPGAGKATVISEIVLVYKFGTTAYDVSGTGRVFYGWSGNLFGAFDPATPIFDKTESWITCPSAAPIDFGNWALTLVANTAQIVTFASADPANPPGDGTAKVYVNYMTLTLP